jgi:hypothetical protein
MSPGTSQRCRAAAHVAGAALVLATSGCERPKRDVDLAEGQAALKGLHARLEAAVDRDPMVAEALAGKTDVVIGIRKTLVEQLAREVADAYLAEVTLDLRSLMTSPHGEIRKKTFLGTITAGSWRADVSLTDVRGTVQARPPTVGFGGGKVVGMTVRGVVRETRARVNVDFHWNSKGLVNAICHDFELAQTVTGRVPAQEHTLSGRVVLSADAHSIVARPEFPDRTFRLAVEVDPESWDAIGQALATQDSFFKCGLALDPEDAVGQLKEVVAKGIPIRLPESLFHPVRLPGALQESVVIDDRPASLSVTANRLAVTRDTLWASVDMHVARTRNAVAQDTR